MKLIGGIFQRLSEGKGWFWWKNTAWGGKLLWFLGGKVSAISSVS